MDEEVQEVEMAAIVCWLPDSCWMLSNSASLHAASDDGWHWHWRATLYDEGQSSAARPTLVAQRVTGVRLAGPWLREGLCLAVVA